MDSEVSKAEAAEAILNFLALASDQIQHLEREDAEHAATSADVLSKRGDR